MDIIPPRRQQVAAGNSTKTMEYTNISMSGDSTNRFVLQKEGANPLIVVGLNPSTADNTTPDNTIRRIMSMAEYNGFDSFVMLNIYPRRATKPKDLPKMIDFNIHNENLEYIRLIMNKMQEKPTILLAYGNNVRIRDYMMFCLNDIFTLLSAYSPKFVHIGELTLRGFPRHPLYCKIEQFKEY